MDLKPCPFCGSPAEYSTCAGVHDVNCSNEECRVRPHVGIFRIEQDPRGGTREDVERIWNTRADEQ